MRPRKLFRRSSSSPRLRLIGILCFRAVGTITLATTSPTRRGLTHGSSAQSLTQFVISPIQDRAREIDITAVIVPRVTCDLPLQPIQFKPEWTHLSNLTLADPDFGVPAKIDLLLGVNVFAEVTRQGRRTGTAGSPTAFETDFGWVLAGDTNVCTSHCTITSNHTTLAAGDELLSKFWEIEEQSKGCQELSTQERLVVQHFRQQHFRNEEGRFVVPLPRKAPSKQLGESRFQAVRRYLSLERSLHSQGQFSELNNVMEEYFEKGHAELVPTEDLLKPVQEVFYLPIHAVRKESSTTTKLRAVFDASAVLHRSISQ